MYLILALAWVLLSWVAWAIVAGGTRDYDD
jgi:hypothetical protein